MTSSNASSADNRWLLRYYSIRAVFSIVWIAFAVAIGRESPSASLVLLILYPAWDSVANLVDARRSGGLRSNPAQAFNFVISAGAALSVLIAARLNLNATIGVIGVWAGLSGIFQLATGIRRRRLAPGQWPMIISGAQSALAGAFFVIQATGAAHRLSAVDVAPYAGFGALYFGLASATLWLRGRRTAELPI